MVAAEVALPSFQVRTVLYMKAGPADKFKTGRKAVRLIKLAVIS